MNPSDKANPAPKVEGINPMVLSEDKRDQPFIWFDIELDDMDLSPYEFRVYIHVVRRAGRAGQCWESVQNIADHCNIGNGTTKRALKTLVTKKLLTKNFRDGQTAVYTVNDKTKWESNLGQKQPGPETTPVISGPGGRPETTPVRDNLGQKRPRGWARDDRGGRPETTYKEDPFKKNKKEDLEGSDFSNSVLSSELGVGKQESNTGHSADERKHSNAPAAAVLKKGHAYVPLMGNYQGSDVFLEERQWITKWKSVNPGYDLEFCQWCVPKLAERDYYKGKTVTVGTVREYLHKGNHDTSESRERAGVIAVWWEEYQSEQKRKVDAPRYVAGDSPFDLLGRAV